MVRPTVDPCLLIKKKCRRIVGIKKLNVDYRLDIGTKDFFREEMNASSFFNKKTTDINVWKSGNLQRYVIDQNRLRWNIYYPNLEYQETYHYHNAEAIRLSVRHGSFYRSQISPWYILKCSICVPGKRTDFPDGIKTISKVIHNLQKTIGVELIIQLIQGWKWARFEKSS